MQHQDQESKLSRAEHPFDKIYQSEFHLGDTNIHQFVTSGVEALEPGAGQYLL
jgi:hypothetical protein